ncbi:General stress protein 13 [Anaerohalosphaera lusitana]|uniref:General stress protein 13 n=1 Tax=Anaerohalosphaera lusitana TaxID=1936003 RepID=A0A1U9NN86_9BACT|nr:Tex family protein [Anaerohalosphaera lusitana]AQT69412.1 General stress protein 13 [Anaerohalosphaera lusitana]
MEAKYVSKIADELNISLKQVAAVTQLLEDGATVPFIARYRKEATGSLDEVAITAIRDRLNQLAELDKRREAILKSIDEQGKLTPALKKKIEAAETMTVLEDIYLPYKPKRRTRATIAKEKGLEPLAKAMFEQEKDFDPASEAVKYVDTEKGVETADDALAGARDIIAEWVSEDQQARERIRELYRNHGEFVSKVIPGKEEEGAKYKDYFDFSEAISKAPSHRILAMRRGAKEKFLTLRISVPQERAEEILDELFVKEGTPSTPHVKAAIRDAFKRLIMLSMETEMRLETKKRADSEAIKVFVENLRQLLMAAPLGGKAVLAIDPGFRTGCKVVCLDKQGKLVHNDTIFPHNSGAGKIEQEKAKVAALCERFGIEAVAIGNGTASRETEAFIRSIGLPKSITVVMVNESGASIYSASEAAREEFPDYDLTVRGSVSIGRRLMDPLAELVKIDPKSIGVGQYQHDVDQTMLKNSLDDTVVSCVNAVGVEVNTASKQLLTYVSGLGPSLAERFVAHRDQNGPFKSREDFKNVPGLGAKTFEQCAGFLRVRDARNPLDASAVHPESYPVVEQMAKDLNCGLGDLITNAELRDKIDLHKYVTEKVGLPTLADIKSELSKPGRDPREKFDAFSFAEGVNEMSDLKIGMKLPGIVTNITAFGAFVDIGVHQDGLIHISEMADRFVEDPNEVVKVQQQVEVRVLDVDISRKRIALSLKKEPSKKEDKPKQEKPKRQGGKKPRNDRGKGRGKNPESKKSTVDPNKPLADQLKIGW